ncbi:MAG: RNA polymerase factor sigma-54 [Cellvibrionales bacterium]|nr:RNA polymerase factor sigma-54 [Cellvibrionales bacterium]
MKQSLQLKMGQHLTMTPQLQQAIRLLQLSTLDLQQEIQEIVDTNPMLEVSEENDTSNNSDTENSDSATDLQANANNNSNTDSIIDTVGDDYIAANAAETPIDKDDTSRNDDADWQDNIPSELPVESNWDDVYTTAPTSSGSQSLDFNEMADLDNRNSSAESLSSHLMWQLNLTPMSDTDQLIATAIIDALAPSGMLSISPEELLETFDDELEIELDEIEAVRHRIQQFDPLGVASTDLTDCLMVQLAQLPSQTPWREQAAQIINRHLNLLASRDFTQLIRRTRLKEHELGEVIQLIRSLNPQPGDAYQDNAAQYVVPDVFVEKHKGRWLVQLNPDIAPKIRINTEYASLVKRADSSSDNTFLRDNLQEAKWFLKSLHSRNETLLKVASRIVEHQREFLEHGEEAMKPLVLHDIATDVEMHESTVSRVTTQKYMHTPRGIFELKYFFSSHVATAEGGECSSTAIRAIIKKLVSAENTRKPLSDNKIANLLDDQGIKVARRTVAKYRESMSIPPSNERKRIT